ncbi:DHH family phosphoesterase [Taibaiella soli]|uniref:Bifunctional oligoribonuclease/PAP phosphatase NrnA n=1 Tax=Taibaiella soli TaxID=1649169 RepID=A0A2W2BDZ1_9BACT|nr:DHH family phosphoesterase [Taibaiella soli]PZF71806.1 bifunctional oligoribonuclease/PAP phosphatase NrnA [Taibaiella soli]
MKQIQDVFPLLQSPKKIFITTHHKPDGDAIGSMLGLYHYLTLRGHEVTPVSPSEVPDFLMWMPGIEAVYNYEAETKKSQEALKASDIIFCLDFNDFNRVKLMEPFLTEATQPKVLIDHHMFPKPVWDYGMSIPEKSSTCEMVYDFINLHNGNSFIDLNTAACLYTGVMTDTGSFRFPVTTASVHEMIADLKRRGLEHSKIHEEVYDSWSVNRMRFVGYMLIERMEIFPKWNTGLVTISRKDLQLFQLSTGDTEGLVNYPLSIAGIKFATLITERNDEVKLSFRSKGDFDVNKFAREHFSGGGHFNASGGRSTTTFSDTIAKFKEILSDIHPR